MAGRDEHTHMFRLEVELGPSYDFSREALLRWLVEWLAALHADAPVPVRVIVEPADSP